MRKNGNGKTIRCLPDKFESDRRYKTVEIQKRRPCLIISPDEMNRSVKTIIIAPMTTKSRNLPSRIACEFEKKDGLIVLDQIRAVDKMRLGKNLGEIDKDTRAKVIEKLQEIFAL